MVINLYQKNRWGEMYSNLLKSDTKARKVIPIYIIKTIEDIWKKNNNYKNVAKLILRILFVDPSLMTLKFWNLQRLKIYNKVIFKF